MTTFLDIGCHLELFQMQRFGNVICTAGSPPTQMGLMQGSLLSLT
jgi:hypothetical protein